MSAKGKFTNLFNFRNIIIILIVIMIIGASYVVITSDTGEKENILSVEEVLEDKEYYIESGKEITIEAYYDNFINDKIIEIRDSLTLTGSTPTTTGLRVDYRNVENTSLDERNKYKFTGILQEDIAPSSVIFIASKIDQPG